MPFDQFVNPFKNPADVSPDYRTHAHLQKLFQPDGSYTRPLEDPITLWAVDVLHREYNVPLDAMELELAVDFSEGAHQSGSGRRYLGRVDLVIYDDRYKDAGGHLDVAFIAVEAMEPSIDIDSEGDDQSGKGHYARLNAYAAASASIRYAILTNGRQTRVYRRDFEYPRTLQEIGASQLPPYESAAEAAQHSPYTVILNPDQPDGIETGLTPLTRDKFREVLGDTRSGCHSILRDNEGLQPQEAVDAMVKFLFAKWYDEQATIDLVRQTGEKRAYVFSVSRSTDPERLLVQVRETFEQAKKWEQERLRQKYSNSIGVRQAFKESDVLMFKPHTTQQIVERLQPYSLRRSSADIKGGVFEDFLGKTFRDDLGQYFTPTPVINLMVGILQPTVNDFIGDPACGSARMLTHALDYVRKREYERAVADLAPRLPSLEGQGEMVDLSPQSSSRQEQGEMIDLSPQPPSPVGKGENDSTPRSGEGTGERSEVARVNTLMNGAQYADLKVMDSLAPLDSVTGGITQGLPEHPGFYPGGLTMILTNPPFGSKVTNKRVLEDLAARDGVSKEKGKVVKSLPQEVVFVNRCLEFLAPGGKLAIVLPDGVLANDDSQSVRDWILRWARLKAVVSLPQETFAPYGAGVKTSVVFLQKREKPLTAKGQMELGQEIAEADEDYQVYMARIDNIGYDATGRLSVSDELASLPLHVQETITDFQSHSLWR